MNATDHKTAHNLTTLANIPLVIWLIVTIFAVAGGEYTDFVTWMSHPINIVAAILFICITLKHFALELEVVFEDYISNICVRKAVITTMKGFWLVLGLTAIISILKLTI